MRVLGVIAVGVAAACFMWPGVALGKYSGGTGTAGDPYLIGDVNDLHALAGDTGDYDKHFKLVADIDLDPNLPNRRVYTTAIIAADTNSVLSGFQGTEFAGSFDGNGNRIRNMRIDTGGAGNDSLGLLGRINGSTAEVQNLGIEDAVITGGSGSYYLGSLCGALGGLGGSSGGMISNCYATGSVSGDSYLGGLCGSSSSYYGTISNCRATGEVMGGASSECLGGLCGHNSGTISDCNTSSSVSGAHRVGGLCGSNYEIISNCYAECQITGGASSVSLGGLCGYNIDTICDCNSSCEVAGGADSKYLGGLCGYNDYGTISDCNSTCEVSGGTDSEYLGGVCGYNQRGTINNCYSNSNVAGGDNSTYLGGLCGAIYYEGTINNCYSNGNVTGGDNSVHLGGLCGGSLYDGTISNCNATSLVSGGDYLGGLCGQNHYGTISDCYAVGRVSGQYCLGGLCGTNGGTIRNCCAAGSVSGDSSLGGLCGYNTGKTISNCYATSEVAGGDNSSSVGGLCGANCSGTVSNCYATGQVIGGAESFLVGGLCGYNEYGTINNCYATGQVNSGYDSWYLGGLCGKNFGTVSNCYFYLFSGPDNNLGMALDTDQMAEQGSFAGFDFAGNPNDGSGDHWAITAGYCPKLSWQMDNGPLSPGYKPDTNLLGSGTSGDPFQINNIADFNEFIANNQLDRGYYGLRCDISMAGHNFTTAVVNRYFGGHFDGGGHKISNVTIDTLSADTDYLGMFGVICGSIFCLGIENISITGDSDSWYLGGLCGLNSGEVVNCYVSGDVRGGDNSACIGGLCGQNLYRISNCWASGQVVGGTGSQCVGGLCGRSSHGAISNCYATGKVRGGNYSQHLGGLCGYNRDEISKCYAIGPVAGGANSYALGGLCGYQQGDSALMEDNFWDIDSSGMLVGYHLSTYEPGTVNNVLGKTTEEMQTEGTFTDAGWDFSWGDGDEAEWFIQVGEYPILVWQIGPGDIYADGRNNLRDWAVFAEWWMRDDCGMLNYYCEWADMDFSGDVGVEDLALLAAYWLEVGVYD